MSIDRLDTSPPNPDMFARILVPVGRWITRHWVLATILAWLALSTWLAWDKGLRINYLGLSDTDDNMRLAQVRALLDGQGWLDLRQHRMNWPDGLNMHWSRLVDLPLAGLIVLLKPIFGTVWAEKLACAIAPVLPLFILMASLSLTAKRLIDDAAFPIALAVLATASMTLGMFQPMRVDHHGWQIAMVGLMVAGLVDPKRLRGGLLMGAATSTSLVIGLEMLPYLAIGGAIIVALWIWREEVRATLIGYATALALGTVVGFALFTSIDNQQPVCDALSPVWFSTAMAASAVLAILGFTRTGDWRWRLAIAGAAALAIGTFFASAWPQCLGRPENVSPELNRLWLGNVREAKSVFAQSWKLKLTILAVPVLGLIGVIVELWAVRRDPEKLVKWTCLAALSIAALALLAWQTRAGPTAQMLAVMGVAALAWRIRRKFKLFPAAIILAGALVQSAVNKLPEKPASAEGKLRGMANAQCPTISNMKLLNRLRPGKMLTFVDLGPRLIVTTHHDAVTGPYHRNEQAILDIHHFFDRDEANAREIIDRRAIDYVMICPDTNESTLYKSRSPNGFYMTLAYGKAPDWLAPVELPKWAPYKVWKVRR